MSNTIWITLLTIAIGTYLIRLLPYLWMARKLERENTQEGIANMPSWLTILGPTMIAAMFGTSLVPGHPSVTTWFATFVGVLMTYLVWRRTRSMGWPIFSGVAVFGVVVVLLG